MAPTSVHSRRYLFAFFYPLFLHPAYSLSNSGHTNSISMSSAAITNTPKIIKISESTWRTAASKHSQRIKCLLQPGLTSLDHPMNAGSKRMRKRQQSTKPFDGWTALDPVNPVYNFLIEYYGLKGAKGPRRLARWSPDPKLLTLESSGDELCKSHETQLQSTSEIYRAAMEASHGLGGILLENANFDDLGGMLHLRGSVPVPVAEAHLSQSTEDEGPELHGILYNPAVFYNRHLPINNDSERRDQLLRSAAPFQWYTSILQTTLNSDPILHCYGLHEWAMQYHPEGAPPPPSAKYQSSLNLRVPRQVINDTIERKGVRCTHVDALRFFAPAAGPLNHHGAQLERMDQLRLEQKGCVHAHMDLLKIGLKLSPFIDSELIGDILEIALEARQLDVAASPYDATEYGVGVVPVETNEGRRMYRDRQMGLMGRAEFVRERLLDAYEKFMMLAFDEELLLDRSNAKEKNENTEVYGTQPYVAPERLAKAEPGGLPWRKNLIES
mmetsp:Transcript_12206/g.21157  ORF Transcript_12206/g.21157 Transcript_12206/m.21157 type:complete len:498 (-) Transcript_12206:64-1557(-)